MHLKKTKTIVGKISIKPSKKVGQGGKLDKNPKETHVKKMENTKAAHKE